MSSLTNYKLFAITNASARSARRFGLTISLKKTEVIYQPKPGADYTAPTITIDNNPLKVTDKFTYFGSTISENRVLHGPGLGPRAGLARSPWTGPGRASMIFCGPGRMRA